MVVMLKKLEFKRMAHDQVGIVNIESIVDNFGEVTAASISLN